MIATKSKGWIGVAAWLAVSSVGAAVWVHQTREALAAQRLAVADLQAEVGDLRDTADQREELTLELERLKGCVGRYVTILPVPELATEERVLQTLQRHCEESGITISSTKTRKTKVKARKRSERKRTFTEVPLQLQLEGSHESFLRFVNLLEREKRLIRVNTFSLTTPDPLLHTGAEPLKIQLEVSTFRYEA